MIQNRILLFQRQKWTREKHLFLTRFERMTDVERYSWMIILAIMGMISLIAFFYFLFKDRKRTQVSKLPKKNYLLDYSLLLVVVVCIILAVYLYFDVQKQIQLLERMM